VEYGGRIGAARSETPAANPGASTDLFWFFFLTWICNNLGIRVRLLHAEREE